MTLNALQFPVRPTCGPAHRSVKSPLRNRDAVGRIRRAAAPSGNTVGYSPSCISSTGASSLKQGKSELAAAVALLLCCGDGEERAEVYGCAADRQQASIVFEVAADMVRMCPALNKRVKILASQKRIIYQPTNSFYQVLSAEAYSKHGFNIHGVVFDELHTQPNRKLFDVMTKGSGDARMQPLYFLITTAGTDTNSICYETHQKAKDILEGRKIDLGIPEASARPGARAGRKLLLQGHSVPTYSPTAVTKEMISWFVSFSIS